MIQVSDVGVGDSSKALIAVLDRIVFFFHESITNIQIAEQESFFSFLCPTAALSYCEDSKRLQQGKNSIF